MKLLSGFKTHPCVNLKNGCHEEIPAKLHWKLMIKVTLWKMVPCPNMTCDETFIFKDLEQYILSSCHWIYLNFLWRWKEWIYYIFILFTNEPKIFEIYKKEAELVNGRNHYEHQGPKQIEWFQRFVGGMIPVFLCFVDMIATVYLQNDSWILLEWSFQQNAGIILQVFVCFCFVL